MFRSSLFAITKHAVHQFSLHMVYIVYNLHSMLFTSYVFKYFIAILLSTSPAPTYCMHSSTYCVFKLFFCILFALLIVLFCNFNLL
jgi:hypothetical protein